jgi:hypothetical protein
MSRWANVDGRTGERVWRGKGASRRLAVFRRLEAEMRNDCTPWERIAECRRARADNERDALATVADLKMEHYLWFGTPENPIL